MPRRQSLERNPSNSSDLNPRKKKFPSKDKMASNNEYLCPICFTTIREATITKCGHTYCAKCITKSIDISKVSFIVC